VNTDRLKEDFRIFLVLLWREMGLPDPTKMQLLFADTLQQGNHRKLGLLGFRGFAKTLICIAFALWNLYKDQSLQIAFWSSNQDNAADSTKLMLKLIKEIDWLSHLYPTPDQDQSALSFDVRGRGISRGSSVMAFGIGGSITGTRADILIVDDPETSSNGDTAKKRISIDRAMNEATFVIKDGGRIVVLGTVHFDDSLYTRLMGQGYQIYLFPMATPSEETQRLCWPYYLPPVRKMIEETKEGSPLDRFTPEEIELKRQTGLLAFERQCLVNPFRTSLSKKPLKLSKVIVFPADKDKLPTRFFHGEDQNYLDNETMGFSSASLVDKLYRPYKVGEEMAPYDYKLAYVDPAGSGVDETALVIVGVSSGYAVVFHVEGMKDGASPENMDRILERCVFYDVDEVCIESNFGQELYAQLLRGHYAKVYGKHGMGSSKPLAITTHRQTVKKGTRIISALDSVINYGRMVMTREAFISDYESANIHETEDKMTYRLSYQISYFSEDGEKLDHDDRIDSLGSAIEKLSGFLAVHPQEAAETYDSWLIRKAFEQDQQIFVEMEEPNLVYGGTLKTHIPTRKTFIPRKGPVQNG
jgi:hypothetical protein